MWYVPDNGLLRVLPFAVVAVVCLWGMISPGTNWRALWGWQQRYRGVAERDRAAFVRTRLIVPLILSVVIGVAVWFL